MGMDVFGTSGNYFRASIWSWRAILLALFLSGFTAPDSWACNDGDGLESAGDCLMLADQLEDFLHQWDGDTLVYESDAPLRVDQKGRFVDRSTPGSKSPYSVERDHLTEFVSFLRTCDGFEIR